MESCLDERVQALINRVKYNDVMIDDVIDDIKTIYSTVQVINGLDNLLYIEGDEII